MRQCFSIVVPQAKFLHFNLFYKGKQIEYVGQTRPNLVEGKLCSEIIFNEMETLEFKFYYDVLNGL